MKSALRQKESYALNRMIATVCVSVILAGTALNAGAVTLRNRNGVSAGGRLFRRVLPHRNAALAGFGKAVSASLAIDRDSMVRRDGADTLRQPDDYERYVPEPPVSLADPSLSAGEKLSGLPAAILSTLQGGQGAPILLRREDRRPVLDFYVKRDFAPLWVGPHGLGLRARRLLATLGRVDEDGLDANDYLPGLLSRFDDNALEGVYDRDKLARLDIELTVKLLRYAHDASAGRVDPDKLTRYNDLRPKGIEAAVFLATIEHMVRPDHYLTTLHPTHPLYRAMKAELSRLRGLAEKPFTQRKIPAGVVIRPGMKDPRIAQIRDRLECEGLLAPQFDSHDRIAKLLKPDNGKVRDAATRSNRYGGDMAGAVRVFQKREGLVADGLIGPKTLAAFNGRNSAEKIRMLILNMERMRWLPRDFGNFYILVNEPAFELRVYDHGVVAYGARVVVGLRDHQTPAFSDTMTSVEFNPYWNVPRSIVLEEMVPELLRDPDYLDSHGYQTLSMDGYVINATAINWSEMNRKTLRVRIRQTPGRDNALGKVKFLFPNWHEVYMHDTPSKALFESDVRAFSHGCVRVQNADRLAELLLTRDGWTAADVSHFFNDDNTRWIGLRHEVKVHLVYLTAWPGADGQIHYLDDVYGRDRRLASALGNGIMAMLGVPSSSGPSPDGL
ncbi:MAG: L,D-transpeptidase family protein [Hyphomicrobiales bacterium]